MNFRHIILSLLIAVVYVAPADADVAARADALIKQHIQAIRSENPDATIAAWKELHKDPDAHTFIQNNHSGVYAYIKLKELAFRLKESQRKRGINYTFPSAVSEDVGPPKGAGNLRGNQANKNVTRHSPNQNRSSNNNRLSNSRITTTNSDTVRSSSNQDRVRNHNNQRRMRSRVR